MINIFLLLCISQSITAMHHQSGNPSLNGHAFYQLIAWIKELASREKKPVLQENNLPRTLSSKELRIYHTSNPVAIITPREFSIMSFPQGNGQITFLGPYPDDSDEEENSQE